MQASLQRYDEALTDAEKVRGFLSHSAIDQQIVLLPRTYDREAPLFMQLGRQFLSITLWT